MIINKYKNIIISKNIITKVLVRNMHRSTSTTVTTSTNDYTKEKLDKVNPNIQKDNIDDSYSSLLNFIDETFVSLPELSPLINTEISTNIVEKRESKIPEASALLTQAKAKLNETQAFRENTEIEVNNIIEETKKDSEAKQKHINNIQEWKKTLGGGNKIATAVTVATSLFALWYFKDNIINIISSAIGRGGTSSAGNVIINVSKQIMSQEEIKKEMASAFATTATEVTKETIGVTEKIAGSFVAGLSVGAVALSLFKSFIKFIKIVK